MRIRFISPDPRLTQFVNGYIVVEDLAGNYANRIVRTCPEPVGVLSVNLGKGARDSSGRAHPKTALLGVQTKVRQWIPQGETYFVAAFLTIPGLVSFFPASGGETADALVALDQLTNDRSARSLYNSIPDNFDIGVTKKQLDDWFLAQLDHCPVGLVKRATELSTCLLDSRSIRTTGATAGTSTRTLERFFARHVGVCPRMVLNLDRIRASVSAVQSRGADRGSGFRGFADQAHQIRTWKRFLEETPSAYRRTGGSKLARLLNVQHRENADRTVFWL